MRCKNCNVDLGEKYTVCPLCSGAATNESAKLQGISTAEYSSDAPAKVCYVSKEKKSFSIEKIKAFFNL